MAVIVSPVVPFATINNRERFLSLLQDVADESFHHEPNCLGYCWLVSETVGSNEVRGLEIYASEDALKVTHRAGKAYEKFRSALSTEQLAPPPAPGDLVFWYDKALEFCQRKNKKFSFAAENQCRIVTTEYKVNDPMKIDALLALLKTNIQDKSHPDLLLYIVSTTDDFKRVLLVEGYATTESCNLFRDLEPTIVRYSQMSGLIEMIAVQAWKPSGVGFFRWEDDLKSFF